MRLNLYLILFINLIVLLCYTNAFAQAPQINVVSKLTGNIGSQVTIQGANFGSTPANNIVFFGSVMAVVNTASSSSLTVTVPAGLMYQPITVLNTTTGLQASSANPFSATFNDDNKKSFSYKSFSRTGLDNTDGHFWVYIQSADIDGDGRLDLAVANSTGQKVSIYRNTSATGQLTASALKLSAIYTVTPSYLAHGFRDLKFSDLDGDGKLDMVLVYIDKSSVAVYRNNSSPGIINSASFEPKVEFSINSGPMSVTFADINADGKPEIITANNGNRKMSVLRNISTKGSIHTGSFASEQTFDLNGYGCTIVAADMNNDNQIDLVVGEKGGVEILFNKSGKSGVFTFNRQKVVTNITGSNMVAVADLDNDGKKDIVSGWAFERKIAVIRNNAVAEASVTFDPSKTIELDVIIYTTIILDDINGDTKPDIILGTPGVIPNESTSSLSFGEYMALPASGFGPSITDDFTVGDFDNDGKVDLITNDGTNTISVIKNNIVGLPLVSSFSPGSAARGENVTIKGKYLDKVTAVSFGGTPAAFFQIVSSTELVAKVGEGLSGAIAFTTNDGKDSVSGFTFIPPPQPIVAAFEPAIATVDETVIITGSNFSEVNAVFFGNTRAKSFTVVSSTQINAVPGGGSSGDVKLTTKFGSGSKSGFTYVLKPVITAFSPKTASKGEVITITGNNFIEVTGVDVGGIPVSSYELVSSSEIRATMGYGASGDVTVRTVYGSYKTSYSKIGYQFSFSAGLPVINSFLPLEAPAGAKVTISGDHFHPDPAQNYVYFGATRASVVSATGTEIVAIVPSGATYEPVMVLVNNRYSYSTLPFTLTHEGFPITKSSFGNAYVFRGNKAFIHDLNFDGKPEIVHGHESGLYSSSALQLKANKSAPGFFNFVGAQSSDSYESLRVDELAFLPGGFHTDLYLSTRSSGGTRYFREKDIYPSTWEYPYGHLGRLGDGDQWYGPNSMVVTDMNKNGSIELVSDSRFKNFEVADLNADGLPEVVVRNEESNSLTIYKNISVNNQFNSTTFRLLKEIKLAGMPTSVSTGDFDDDGKIDFLVSVNPANGEGYVSFYNNVGIADSIMVEKQLDIRNIARPLQTGVGDLDGDGKVDLILNSNLDSTFIYTNKSTNGNFVFSESLRMNLASSMGIEVCDMDQDGRPDLITSGNGYITIFRNLKSDPRLDSFTPKSAKEGGLVTIIGGSFTGTTSVKFGGIPASSFEVISPDTIRAVVAQGNSGNIEISNASGLGNISGFNYVTKPVIYISTNVAKAGEYIWLSISPLPGVIYRWYRDGQLIDGETSNSLKAYTSGSYSLSVEIENTAFMSDAVKLCVGCSLPSNSFTISTKDISCRGLTNGSFKIKAASPEFEYEAKMTSGYTNHIFKDSLELRNLGPGTYSVCIALKALPETYRCYTLTIAEPEELRVYSILNEKDRTLTLQLAGADNYLIQLNRETYSTRESTITLKLKEGINDLTVNSDKICQGEYRQVLQGNNYALYPMPFSSMLTIMVPGAASDALDLSISDLAGKIILNKVVTPVDRAIHLDLSFLSSGLYLLKLEGSESIFKIVKK